MKNLFSSLTWWRKIVYILNILYVIMLVVGVGSVVASLIVGLKPLVTISFLMVFWSVFGLLANSYYLGKELSWKKINLKD